MWLIDVGTLNLKHIIELDAEIHKYAILSHAWGPEEVSFQEMTAREPGMEIKKMGYEKIKRCCEQAKADGYEFAWVDTCCIDKSSSAELSESINSMFSWYQQAQVCYVIMYDVPAATAFSEPDSSFAKSRWFTRGWTLQELIAPRQVEFFSMEWTVIGTKSSLVDRLYAITNIDKGILTGEEELDSISIARRMSWAAKRNTTRVEDMAYCLLGIFDINMPMLYGEGKKAFIRLQEEIIKSSDDHSIFAWADANAGESDTRGLMALHPRCFENSADFVAYRSAANPHLLKLEISNLGVIMSVRRGTDEQGRKIAYLNCTKGDATDSFAFIYLKSAGEESIARFRAADLGVGYRSGKLGSITIRQNPKAPRKKKVFDMYFSITIGRLRSWHIENVIIPMHADIASADQAIAESMTARKLKPISYAEFGNLSAYGYKILGPGQVILTVRLAPNEIVGVTHGMWIIIGRHSSGKLGAHLVDLEDYFKEKFYPVFKGPSCPGESKCETRENGNRFVLERTELSAAECKFGDKGMHLELRHD